jgi:hypothetical protein
MNTKDTSAIRKDRLFHHPYCILSPRPSTTTKNTAISTQVVGKQSETPLGTFPSSFPSIE